MDFGELEADPFGVVVAKCGGASRLFEGKERQQAASRRRGRLFSSGRRTWPHRTWWRGRGAAQLFEGDLFAGDVFTTSGPVTNMWEVLSTMKMKSVMAGL